MEDFKIYPLTPADVPATCPLIRQVVPTLDLAHWSRFARRFADPKRTAQHGILVARGSLRPFPTGLFCYRREPDLPNGYVLFADHFVAIDLLDPQPIIDAMVAELDALAARLGCHAIRSVVHNDASRVSAGLSAAGHKPEGATLCKQLTGGAASKRAAIPGAMSA
jgi:hypothetical protein